MHLAPWNGIKMYALYYLFMHGWFKPSFMYQGLNFIRLFFLLKFD